VPSNQKNKDIRNGLFIKNLKKQMNKLKKKIYNQKARIKQN